MNKKINLVVIITAVFFSCSNITSNGKIELVGEQYYLKNTSFDKKVTFTIEKSTTEKGYLTNYEVETKISTDIYTLNPGEISKQLTVNYEHENGDFRRSTCKIVGEIIEPQN